MAICTSRSRTCWNAPTSELSCSFSLVADAHRCLRQAASVSERVRRQRSTGRRGGAVCSLHIAKLDEEVGQDVIGELVGDCPRVNFADNVDQRESLVDLHVPDLRVAIRKALVQQAVENVVDLPRQRRCEDPQLAMSRENTRDGRRKESRDS